MIVIARPAELDRFVDEPPGESWASSSGVRKTHDRISLPDSWDESMAIGKGFVPPGAGTRQGGSDEGSRVEDRLLLMDSRALT